MLAIRVVLFGVILLSFFSLSSLAQIPGARDSLRAEAARMMNAFDMKDFQTYVRYMQPNQAASMGGPEALARRLASEAEPGTTFETHATDTPSIFVRSGTEWQATLEQKTIVKSERSRIMFFSVLVCFSDDNGAHWTFVDANDGQHLDDLRKIIPNLSPKIVIQPFRVRHHQ
jgi:hypothetical protein